ncbi:MAG: type II toxin-antitoxin system RelE/ParE family toxin [Bacteroidetes bacterium]|nr:type II toxin-antitoxin system RelE/ParE family toxin [Bacteroidota bacterium]
MKRKCEVRLLPQAEEDLIEIIEYITEDKPSAAEKMLDRFEKAFQALSENPMVGRMAREHRLKLLQYRVLVVEPYLLFYQIKKKSIFIFRILHGARDYSNIV